MKDYYILCCSSDSRVTSLGNGEWKFVTPVKSEIAGVCEGGAGDVAIEVQPSDSGKRIFVVKIAYTPLESDDNRFIGETIYMGDWRRFAYELPTSLQTITNYTLQPRTLLEKIGTLLRVNGRVG